MNIVGIYRYSYAKYHVPAMSSNVLMNVANMWSFFKTRQLLDIAGIMACLSVGVNDTFVVSYKVFM